MKLPGNIHMYLEKNAWDSNYTLKFKQKYKSQTYSKLPVLINIRTFILIVLKYEELLISNKW